MDIKSTSKTSQSKEGFLRRVTNSAGRRIAGILSKNFEPLSTHKKKALLICSGVAVTLVSGSMIVLPFLRNSSNLSGLMPARIEIPHVRNLPDETFSEEDYLLLMGFKKTLDSLKRYDPQVYRQLVQGREGLLDSIDYLVDIYTRFKK